MLTLFAIPKPFKGHAGLIQRNAVASWVKLLPPRQVVLCGTAEGCDAAAELFGTCYVPNIKCNEYGTPLLSDLFHIANDISNGGIVCFVNSDIMFTSSLITAVDKVAERKRKFLLVGRRTNLDIKETWNFEQPNWQSVLAVRASAEGALFKEKAIDYFIYSSHMWGQIPPFVIGRAAFDNWLIYRARELKAPVIDATGLILAVHQNHDYSHMSGGKNEVFRGPEAQRNRELAGGQSHIFHIGDATWNLNNNGLRRALDPKHIMQRLRRLSTWHPLVYKIIRPFWVVVKTFIILPAKIVNILLTKAQRRKDTVEKFFDD